MDAMARRQLMTRVEEEAARCGALAEACARCSVSLSTYTRWAARWAEAGMDGLADLPRSGRPPSVRLTPEEADHLRRAFLRSNLRDGAGSMTAAARWSARDASSPLTPETRAAILKPRASKHLLPSEVVRAFRAAPAAVVSRYRDPKSGLNDGHYTPGWLRMATDGERRLVPGERQVWDDASVNVGVVVPWTRGGDRCAERFGCRVARFQLLAGIDCAGDFCVGRNYVMHANDAYDAADVVSTLWRCWSLNGYAPDECVMEGGAWQSRRALDFLAASGVRLISAKGRPNQKLVESWFNRLWTVLSISLPPSGQVGRFRGEMEAENAAWRRCREGAADPREHFPLLTEFLSALDRSVAYLNAETVQSREYGAWVPAEAYAARAAKGHPLPQGLRRYGLPVRETRRLGRQGMARVTCECPFGWSHAYVFASESAWAFDGAAVTVSFDPADIRSGAVFELAEPFRGSPAGTVIDPAAACVSAAPELTRCGAVWGVGAFDAREGARAAKRSARAKIGSQVAVYDGRGVMARHAEHEGAERYGFGPDSAPQLPEPAPQQDPDWASLEAEAGVLVS